MLIRFLSSIVHKFPYGTFKKLFHVQDVEPNAPIWRQQLTSLFRETDCTRETCFISSSFVDTNGSSVDAVPDNYIYLTSFPNVGNMQMANLQVEPSFVI